MKDIEGQLLEAKRKISAGELGEAEAVLKEAVIRHPNDARIHAQLGGLAYRRKDNFGAMASLAQAILLNPNLVEARIIQIKVALRQNQNRVACDLAEELLKIDNADPKVVDIVARAFAKARQFDRAAEEWYRLAEHRSWDAAPLIEAAGHYMKAEAFDRARECATRAIERDPASAQPLAIMAAVLDALHDLPEFAATIRQMTAIDPVPALEFVPTLIAYGLPELAAEVIIKARAALVEVDPAIEATVTKSLSRQAKAAHEMQDNAKAARLWSALLAIDPVNAGAKSGVRKIVKPLVETARQAADSGESARAYAVLKEAVTIDSEDARLWREFAKQAAIVGAHLESARAWLQFDRFAGPNLETIIRACKLALKDEALDESFSILFEARRRFPGEPQIAALGDALAKRVFASGKAALDAEDMELAAAKAALIERWEPESATAERIMSKVRSTASTRFKAAKAAGGSEAIAAAEFLARVSPTRSDAINLLAEHHYENRQYKTAVGFYASLVQQDQTKERYWIRLLKCYAANQDQENGIPVALKILERYPDSATARQILGEMLQRQSA